MQDDLTTVEVIGLAIRSEEDAAEFYGQMSKRIKNDLVKSKFEALAKEEAGHRSMLVALYKRATGSEDLPPRVPGGPDTAEKAWAGVDIADFEELLNLAISRENEASKFYKEAAKRAADISGKRTLEYLSDIEHGHEVMLKSELKAYLRDRDWYANNPDIQLVGP